MVCIESEASPLSISSLSVVFIVFSVLVVNILKNCLACGDCEGTSVGIIDGWFVGALLGIIDYL